MTTPTCRSILAVGLHIRSAGFCQDNIIPEVPHLQGKRHHIGSHPQRNTPTSTPLLNPCHKRQALCIVSQPQPHDRCSAHAEGTWMPLSAAQPEDGRRTSILMK